VAVKDVIHAAFEGALATVAAMAIVLEDRMGLAGHVLIAAASRSAQSRQHQCRQHAEPPRAVRPPLVISHRGLQQSGPTLRRIHPQRTTRAGNKPSPALPMTNGSRHSFVTTPGLFSRALSALCGWVDFENCLASRTADELIGIALQFLEGRQGLAGS